MAIKMRNILRPYTEESIVGVCYQATASENKLEIYSECFSEMSTACISNTAIIPCV
jgi:hypothetical protein